MARFEEFWEVLCDFRQYLRLGLTFCIFLLILAIMSLLLAPRGTSSFFLAVVNFVMTTALTAAVGGCYWACLKRAKQYY